MGADWAVGEDSSPHSQEAEQGADSPGGGGDGSK